jgi:predicted HTH domain antitoxin
VPRRKKAIFVASFLDVKKYQLMFVLESDILEAAHITEEEVKIELAILLYRKQRLSYAQARALSGLRRIEFDDLLFAYGVPTDFTVEDLHQDVRTSEKIRVKNGDRQ